MNILARSKDATILKYNYENNESCQLPSYAMKWELSSSWEMKARPVGGQDQKLDQESSHRGQGFCARSASSTCQTEHFHSIHFVASYVLAQATHRHFHSSRKCCLALPLVFEYYKEDTSRPRVLRLFWRTGKTEKMKNQQRCRSRGVPIVLAICTLVGIANGFVPSARTLSTTSFVATPTSGRVLDVTCREGKTELNMFMGSDGGILGIGTPELFTILLVGYFVLGPSDLYKVTKEIGKFVQNVRKFSDEATSTLENSMESQLQLEEIRKAQRELNDAFSFRRSINVEEDSNPFEVNAQSPR
eukprot:scaffold26938_cov113-Cylindrotheca_fusiformis.AAC.1